MAYIYTAEILTLGVSLEISLHDWSVETDSSILFRIKQDLLRKVIFLPLYYCS